MIDRRLMRLSEVRTELMASIDYFTIVDGEEMGRRRLTAVASRKDEDNDGGGCT